MGQRGDTEEESSAPGCACTELLRLVQEAPSPQPGAAAADGAHSRAPFPAGSSLPGHGDATRSQGWSWGSAVQTHLLPPDGRRRQHGAGDTRCGARHGVSCLRWGFAVRVGEGSACGRLGCRWGG